MKKTVLFLLTLLCPLLIFGADYRVLVLGDIHYDNAKYHTSPDGKIKSRYSLKHSAMWPKQASAQLTAAARQLNKDVPFIIQAGDFIEGYGATPELRAQMMLDAFKLVKSHFPEHKLLAVKGNHDVRREVAKTIKGKVRNVAGWDHDTYNKNFMPQLAKELNCKELGSNYSVLHNNDLYIFYDGFIDQKISFKFLTKTLADNPNARKVFFITHLPVLPCSTSDAGWLLPNYAKVAELLAQRNAIILTAHTHQISLVKLKFGSNTLTQWVFSSISYLWNSGKSIEILAKNKDEFYAKISPRKAKTPSTINAKKYLDTRDIEEFTLYNYSLQGFSVLKVNDNGSVEVEVYNDKSNQPVLVKKLH